MPRFTVKERDGKLPCFIYDEENDVVVELNGIADLAHANEVKAFLQKHVRTIRVPRPTLSPESGNA